jgi:Domain of unknown function (DUF4037)
VRDQNRRSMRGAELSRAFYEVVVAPMLDGVPHAAGRLGSGSDVIGIDDVMSRDHDWGCRLTVLVEDGVNEVTERFERELPDEYQGHPVRFPSSWKPRGHQVEVETVDGFARSRLGLIPTDEIDWLLLTGQSLLEVVAGPVFHDGPGRLTTLRSRLAWYPPDVEAYVVASQWHRIDQELPFVGRVRDVGDELGSRVITARLARDVMHLTLLLERRWSPYSKWLGTAYGARGRALDTESSLCAALDELAGRDVTVPFWDRPYQTIDPAFLASRPRGLPLPVGIGSIEQWCDNVDVMNPSRRVQLRSAYEAWRTD